VNAGEAPYCLSQQRVRVGDEMNVYRAYFYRQSWLRY
jgi:hypothetical protein